jgi:colanic acid biosynthesis glycosyl transferase WcaI
VKILVASINFAPDHSGIGVYSTDFPKFLAERGDEVTMVTGFSYYPAWRKLPVDRGRLFATETWNGIRVLRGYLFVPRRVTTAARLWHEATFCFFAALNFLRAGRQDAVVVFSPPFLLGLVGNFFATLWGCPLVVNVQDLPLDAATSLGMVGRGWFSRTVSALERMVYRMADQVATISKGMVESLRAKGVAGEKLALVPNWINVPGVRDVPSGKFRSRHSGCEGKFLVAYAGNLGVKQGVDCLLRLAKAVEDDGRFHFFLIGDGADKARLLAIAGELRLRNTSFLDLLGPDDYRAMLADVDVVFVAQRRGAGDHFFPSKLLGVMAQSKPMLVAADPASELSRAVEMWKCGRVASPDDISALAERLRELAADGAGRCRLGENGRCAVLAFDRGKVLEDWRDRIRKLVERSGKRT